MDSNEIRRVIIVHVHMFKNAGSTFDWSLRNNFGKDFIDHRDDENMRKGAKYFEHYLKNKANIKAISSHHIKLPLPDIDGVLCIPVFLFRHPIDRIGSVYAFEKKQNPNTTGAIKAKELDFHDYVRWFMDESRSATLRNFQTRYCSGQINGSKNLTEKDFKDAILAIYRTPLVGVVERYAESMVLFEQKLKNFFPSIDLSYKMQNVGKRQNKNLEARIKHIETELGDDTMKLVMENNKYDFMLYDEANKLLTSRVSDVVDFHEKVKRIAQS